MQAPQVVEKIIRVSENHATSGEHTAQSVSRQDPAANSRTSCERTGPASRKSRGGEEAQDHQDESAEKESDHPGPRSVT